jgi:hypothetical protein
MAFRQQIAAVDLQNLHYELEQILMMKRDKPVDLLVRNCSHLTSKTAVISRSSYLEYAFGACQNFPSRQFFCDVTSRILSIKYFLLENSSYPSMNQRSII